MPQSTTPPSQALRRTPSPFHTLPGPLGALQTAPSADTSTVRCLFQNREYWWVDSLSVPDLLGIMHQHDFRPGVVGADGIRRVQYVVRDGRGDRVGSVYVSFGRGGQFVSWPDPYDALVDGELIPRTGLDVRSGDPCADAGHHNGGDVRAEGHHNGGVEVASG